MSSTARNRLAIFAVAAIFLVPFTIAVSVWYTSLRAKVPKVELTEAAVDVAGHNNEFALALYHQLRKQDGNLVFSPHSLSTAMAMSYAGAAGTTKNEIAKVFQYQRAEPQLHAAMHNLEQFFAARGRASGVELRSANHLWVQSATNLLPQFRTITDAHYGAEVSRLDFRETELARKRINEWVAEKTSGKVTNIAGVGALSPETTLVVSNAIYFKGAWKSKFDRSKTNTEKFFVAPDRSVDTPLMHQSGMFHMSIPEGLNESGFKILELPYVDDSLAMYVFLPNSSDGLPKLEAKLTSQNLKDWLNYFPTGEFDVWLPKFSVASQFDLAKTLATMGMPSAFEFGQADFSGIAGTKDLCISAVLHKAYIEVSEEGTEAAAATVDPHVKSEGFTSPVEFRADHPFVYLIRDQQSGAILFMGRMVDPTRS